MIPYDLLCTSASRPHLLRPTLQTFFKYCDQPPQRLLINDDPQFPGQRDAIRDILAEVNLWLPVIPWWTTKPIYLGAALQVLLAHVETEYVVYIQDDFETLRSLPISDALEVMHQHHLHHIRFNKRKTMAYKGEADRRWFKKEYDFEIEEAFGGRARYTLTTADHWYFQTSVWRVSQIKPVVDWYVVTAGESFREHTEPKINRALNGELPDFPRVIEMPQAGEAFNDPEVRARRQKTFIWGPIAEPMYIKHIGHLPADWAEPRTRQGQTGIRETF